MAMPTLLLYYCNQAIKRTNATFSVKLHKSYILHSAVYSLLISLFSAQLTVLFVQNKLLCLVGKVTVGRFPPPSLPPAFICSRCACDYGKADIY